MHILRRRRQEEIEKQFNKPIKELLEHLYYFEKLGIKKISKKIGVSDKVLWYWFNELGIDKRDKSQAVANQWTNNDERKKKQSDFLKGVVTKFYKNGGQSPMKRPEVAAKVSAAKMGEKNFMYNKFGDKNPMWKGGKITYRGRGWVGIKNQVIRRDGNKCRRCGSTKLLQVHHIVPYRYTQDNSFENLVTLCASCHMAVEHKGATWS